MKITKACRIPSHLTKEVKEPLSTLVSKLAKEFIASDNTFLSPTYEEPTRTSLYIEHTLIDALKEKAAAAHISLDAAIVQLLEIHLHGAPSPIPEIRRRAPRT